MSRQARILAIIGILLVSLIVLVAGTWLIWNTFAFDMGSDMRAPGQPRGGSSPRDGGSYDSNGERIYFTGSSRTGPDITAQMEGMRRMPPGMMACVSCHGPDGTGGTVRMMMDTFEAPNIRWENLTSQNHEHESDDEHGEEAEEHPAYNEESLKVAITEGLNPAGEQLDWMMPRWDMTEDQLDDLIEYLQSLN